MWSFSSPARTPQLRGEPSTRASTAHVVGAPGSWRTSAGIGLAIVSPSTPLIGVIVGARGQMASAAVELYPPAGPDPVAARCWRAVSLTPLVSAAAPLLRPVRRSYSSPR